MHAYALNVYYFFGLPNFGVKQNSINHQQGETRETSPNDIVPCSNLPHPDSIHHLLVSVVGLVPCSNPKQRGKHYY